MKKSIFILLFLFYGMSIFSQNETKIWQYSKMRELQKKEKWIELPYSEKLNSCQIPDSLLLPLKTEELLDICLYYPLNGDMLLFNNLNSGFNHVISNFNGWKEFLIRKNALNILYKKYNQEFDISNIENLSDLESKNSYRNSMFFIEKIIEQTDLTLNSPAIEKKVVLRALYNSYQKKLNYPQIYNGYCFHSNILAMLKILESENNVFSLKSSNFQKEYDLYKTKGRTNNLFLINNIIEATQSYLDK